MNIESVLNDKLLNQSFAESRDESLVLQQYRYIAYNYAKLENSIAVLSDLKSDKSYIYNGGTAEKLEIATRGSSKEIHSIWEKDLFERIHPEDLIEKHLFELQFFHLLKTLPIERRSDFYVSSKMRMCNKSGDYMVIHHRMFYVCNCPLGNLWLALCLYNYSNEESFAESPYGVIIDSYTGDIIKADKEKCSTIISEREREILRLIEKGKLSKEIADLLSISKNTVDRHRQNILIKLRVKNSLEACRVAKLMNLL